MCHRDNNVRFGLGLGDVIIYDDITMYHYDVIIVKLHQEPPTYFTTTLAK